MDFLSLSTSLDTFATISSQFSDFGKSNLCVVS